MNSALPQASSKHRDRRGSITLLATLALATQLPARAADTVPVTAGDESTVVAQDTSRPAAPLPQLDTIVVTAPPSVPAREADHTTSRLGLSAAETPAMVEVLTQEEIQAIGARNLVEVYSAAPGVVAGNLPGEPGMTSIRGFSSGAVTYLFDGSRASDSGLVSRNYDSFNFERVEILKGPASVIHGTGSLAGAVNLVSKQPKLRETSFDALVNLGSFDSLRTGLGGNIALGDKAAARADLSYSRSNGYVDDTGSRLIGLTSGVTFEPTDRLTLSASLDYFEDRFTTPYQGTPLLPADVARNPSHDISGSSGLVLDESIRDRNYNVDDGLMQSDALWLRTRVRYKLDEHWSLVNELGRYDADRHWTNSEDFSYDTTTDLLNRSTTKILHDHQFWSERIFTAFDGAIAGHRNRFSIGVEYNDTDFDSTRRFGTTTAVDPFDPDRGQFPDDTAANFPGAGNRALFDSKVETRVAFLENALNLTPEWLAIVGLRYDFMDLERKVVDENAQATTDFGRDYEELSWRVGSVYALTPSTQVYTQFNHAVVPVTSLLLSNALRAGFDLSTGESIEGGVRTAFWNERAAFTAAAFRIEQDDILTRDSADPTVTVQGGTREAKGVELELEVALTPRWSASANATYVESEFTKLIEAGGADRSGNRPPNVPEKIWNLRTSYRLPTLPLTFGAGLRHAGNFYTSNANTVKVDGHTLLDASIAWDSSFGTLTLRGRNLTDAFYADWSGYSATQVYIGAERSVDLSWTTHF